ncbi:MAG: OadG family protein [Gammaproteobacteria bacterium]|nr:OadG family protein [Gammaproteobacteria bacterium]
MPVDTLLSTSVELMVIGMGTVFIILALLIACMNLLRLFAPIDEHTPSCSDDKPLIAAIQTAIHHYRNRSVHKTAL